MAPPATATAIRARAAPPPAPLCVSCHERPRLGALTRCTKCIRAAAELERAERDARRVAFEARAAEAEAIALASKTKRCRSCKAEKPISMFAKHRLAKDGRRKDCKSCVAKAAEAKPKEKTPARIAAIHALKRTPEHALSNRAAVANWSEANPQAVLARYALKRAVERGTVRQATTCEAKGCSSKQHLQGHHGNYSQPRRVAWLCARHHRRLHASGAALSLKKTAAMKFARVPKQKTKEKGRT